MNSRIPITGARAKPQVDRSSVQSLAAFAAAKLTEQLRSSSKLPVISDETKKDILKRVSPKAAAEFSIVENLPQLVSWEIDTLGERIRLYPFTALYREVINLASKDMVAAWLLHSHSLRQSELYIIQERGAELLRFLKVVSRDFGLAAPDQSKTFEKAFRKRFERRLRERHRLVHAHERPSLTSRVIDFGVAAQESDRDIVESTLADLFMKIVTLLPGDIRVLHQEVELNSGL